MVTNQYLIVASYNIKVKKISSIIIPLFGFPLSLLGLCSIFMGVLRLSLGVRVLHAPKRSKLVQYFYGCIKFKDKDDGICFVLSQGYCIAKV
jgi:hypothetical protein